MKTENTLENKTKFFAQYWGQHLIIMDYFLRKIDHVTLYEIEADDILQLKPISKISDEYAIEVAKIVSPSLFLSSGNDNKHFIDKSEKDWISVKHKRKIFSVDIDLDGYVYEYHEDEGYTRPSKSYAGTDYLRSKGYALPWMDLSVEDLQNYGWIKLKEN